MGKVKVKKQPAEIMLTVHEAQPTLIKVGTHYASLIGGARLMEKDPSYATNLNDALLTVEYDGKKSLTIHHDHAKVSTLPNGGIKLTF